MTIPPIQGIVAISPATAVGSAAHATEATAAGGAGFGETVGKALEAVSASEHQADLVAQDIATGGEAGVHELMVAMTKASLSVDLLVQVRNKAVEAYQEIMRMQI